MLVGDGMNIYKAIKREKKFLKKFYILMIVLAITLPIILLLTGLTNTFYLSYLLFIEFLIFVAVINKMNYYKLDYSCSNNKLRFKNGLLSKESVILCDKVALVHTEKMEEDMDIIIITTVNFKNIAFLFPPTPAYTFPFMLPRTIILPPAYTSAPLFTSPTITMFP